MEKGRDGARGTVADRKQCVELDRRFGWADLFLPDREFAQLRSIASELRERAKEADAPESDVGMILLFVGEHGTGKTMAARILGAELGQPVLEVDVERLQLRDEAEIEAVFMAAEREDAVLVFDTNRSASATSAEEGDETRPAVDVSEIVRRAERYRGLVIFTWIPGEDRHLAMSVRAAALVHPAAGTTVRFPIPSAETREQIWRAQLPPRAVPDAEIQQLAEGFQLSGGAIAHCCASARDASAEKGSEVTTELLVRAIEQEYPDAAIEEPTPSQSEGEERAAYSLRVGRTPSIVVAAALAAGLLGVVLARGTAGSVPTARPDKQAANTLLRVAIPASWHQQPAPAATAPSLIDALAVGPTGASRGVLVLGRAQTTDPSRLPAPFTELPNVPSPQIVTLGGTRFYRYSDLRPPGAGSPSSVYALPTTTGTVFGVCETQAAGTGFTARCERVLASLRLVSDSPLPPGPNAEFAAGLGRVIAAFNSAQAAGERRLDAASTSAAQAGAAAGLAAAYNRAVSAVQALQPGTASTAAAALGNALRATANAYAGLSAAARHADTTAYHAASARLAAARTAVSSALAQLTEFGYRMP